MSDKYSILLLENEYVLREIYNEKLCKSGFNCVVSNNVREAMNVLDNGFDPDIALLDWHAPMDKLTEESLNPNFGPADSLKLTELILKRSEGRCRIVIISFLLGGSLVENHWGGAWGYYSRQSDWNLLMEYLKRGRLRDEEIGKPVLYLNSEFAKRGVERG